MKFRLAWRDLWVEMNENEVFFVRFFRRIGRMLWAVGTVGPVVAVVGLGMVFWTGFEWLGV